MKNKIAYCGLNCEECDAYIATINNDEALREKTAKLWSELNKITILPEEINCLGCREEGFKTGFCDKLCKVRQCGLKKGITTCGKCKNMETCEKIKMIVSNNPELIKNLKG